MSEWICLVLICTNWEGLWGRVCFKGEVEQPERLFYRGKRDGVVLVVGGEGALVSLHPGLGQAIQDDSQQDDG